MTARVATQAAKAAIRGTNTEYSLFVRGLNWRTGKTELKQHFESYGRIKFIHVFMNNYTGVSLGNAIVKFHQYDAFSAALDSRFQDVDGENVEVLASERAKSFLESLPDKIDDAPSVVDAAPSEADVPPSEVNASSEKD